VKEIDETPLPENESEPDLETICALLYPQVAAFMEMETHRLLKSLDGLEKRIANLETQRTPQDENDDPEWYS